MYDLPSELTKKATVFGTSTREDWEATVKNKKDAVRACALSSSSSSSSSRSVSSAASARCRLFVASS